MSLWSFGAQPTQLSTKTYRQAKSWVARIVGGQDDPDSVGAGDAISAAVDELNRRRWEFLTVQGTDIPIVAGTSDYDLPTPFKDPLSLILTSGNDVRTLTYVPRGTWDPITNGQPIGGTYFYTDFAQGLTNKVQLLDTPSSNGTMEIRYYRPITTPVEDDDVLDTLKGPVELALLARAQLWVATWRGVHSDRLQLLERRSERLILQAYGDDGSHADWTPQLIPGRMWMRRPVNPDSTWPWSW